MTGTDPKTHLRFDRVQNWPVKLDRGGELVVAVRCNAGTLTPQDRRFIDQLLGLLTEKDGIPRAIDAAMD